MPTDYGWKVLLALLLAAAGASLFAADPPPNAKPGVLVTISKETTYITEPLRSDGYPDYIAALDQRFHRGVTPENNAAVLFWKAMGPAAIFKEYRERYFEMLGMPPLPEQGRYYITSNDHVILNEDSDATAPAGQRSKMLQEQIWEAAVKRPWSKQEFPVWAAWIAGNEESLALVVEASKRPRRYDPLVAGRKVPMIAVFQPTHTGYRDAGDALVARAMLRLDEGKVDEAWEDVLACYRLGRLLGQGPTLVERLAANRISETAWGGHRALLRHAGLTAARIAKMRRDVDGLPPMPRLGDLFDAAERFTLLDTVATAARDARLSPAAVARSLAFMEKSGLDAWDRESWKLVFESTGDAGIDWDLVFRMVNARCDQCIAVVCKPAGVARREAAKLFDKNAAEMLKSVCEKGPENAAPEDARKSRSRRLGWAFLAEFPLNLATFIDANDRATMRCELTRLAIALAAYRTDRGAQAAKLADLTPQYIVTVPKDIFNDADLHYRAENGGYLLYSVGSNGKDDGGKSYEDREKGKDYDEMQKRGQAYDDLTVRISGEKP
jgi:hypothetical protein